MAGVITWILIVAIAVGWFFGKRLPEIKRTIENKRRHSNTLRHEVREHTSSITASTGSNRLLEGRHLAPASLENITETGPMIYFANDRHGNNDKEYRFNYKKVGDSWKAYILRTPSIVGRSADGSTTHRIHDDNGYYVCWNCPIKTLKDAQNISRVWADSIQEYIATGKKFG